MALLILERNARSQNGKWASGMERSNKKYYRCNREGRKACHSKPVDMKMDADQDPDAEYRIQNCDKTLVILPTSLHLIPIKVMVSSVRLFRLLL